MTEHTLKSAEVAAARRHDRLERLHDHRVLYLNPTRDTPLTDLLADLTRLPTDALPTLRTKIHSARRQRHRLIPLPGGAAA